MLEIVVTARPSWARVKSFVKNYAQIASNQSIRLTLTGSSISRSFGDITSDIPLNVSYKSFATLRDTDSFESAALSSSEITHVLSRHWSMDRPDAVMVIADRAETLGVASAAALCQIPLIHLQGGEISGSIDNKIRDVNSKLADLHLTTNEFTKNRLMELGEKESIIKVIGCPSLDLVREVKENELTFDITKFIGVGSDYRGGSDYGIVMFHPDTLNEIESLQWLSRLISFVQNTKIHWFWFWPNPDLGTSLISKELRRSRELGKLNNVKFLINLKPEEFIYLANSALMIVGNSSFGIREASFLGLPAINLGKRQLRRQTADNAYSFEDLVDSNQILAKFEEIAGSRFQPSNLYGNGISGKLGAQIVHSWTPSLKNL